MSDTTKYQVGYGKPPTHSRFKPGESGNTKGRPKGAKNFKTEILEEAAKKITVREAGKPRKISKRRVLIKRIINNGLTGTSREALAATHLVLRCDDPEKLAPTRVILDADEERLLALLAERAERQRKARA